MAQRQTVQAAVRSPSTCLSHWLMRFQLVKTRLTTFADLIRRFSISAILGANPSRSKRPTDPVLSLFHLCCDFAPVTINQR
jgi:hypothetical protein